MVNIETRYAQHKKGQRLHIVPLASGENPIDTALCGKHVDDQWRLIINVPLANCCRNCARIDRHRGWQRAYELLAGYFLGSR